MDLLKEYADIVIFVVLGLMAFVALWCVVERLLFFGKLRRAAREERLHYPSQEAFEQAISENMTLLNTVYSNAPYVGLLGTVVGIMLTFYDMGMSGTIEVKSVVIGLSLALKATALGLLVAIPSLAAYNLLYRSISKLADDYKTGALGGANSNLGGERGAGFGAGGRGER